MQTYSVLIVAPGFWVIKTEGDTSKVFARCDSEENAYQIVVHLNLEVQERALEEAE